MAGGSKILLPAGQEKILGGYGQRDDHIVDWISVCGRAVLQIHT